MPAKTLASALRLYEQFDDFHIPNELNTGFLQLYLNNSTFNGYILQPNLSPPELNIICFKLF